MTSPIRPTNQQARLQAQGLMTKARFAALAVMTPANVPLISRVGFGLAPDGAPISLVSSLAAHTQALQANPACALMVGEPGVKGDPLTHPRLSLMGRISFLVYGDDGYAALAAHYLCDHPKAKLYIGFADFSFARLTVDTAHLNGGFGKAFHLSAADLGLGPDLQG